MGQHDELAVADRIGTAFTRMMRLLERRQAQYQAEIDKAAGVRINLWIGLGMLALGLFFLVWQWLRPAEAPSANDIPLADRVHDEER